MEDFEKEIQTFWEGKVKTIYNPYAMAHADKNGNPLLYYVFQTDKFYYNPDLLIVGINPGGNYYGEPQLAQKDNYYIKGNDAWATCLRSAFGYGDNEYLSTILENCVGTNRVFINTSSEDDIEKILLPKANELIEELVQIVQPKHIIVLGRKPFDALRGKSKVEFTSAEPKFELSDHKGIPLAYIPNLSRRNRSRYYGDKYKKWQNILEKFLRDELR